MKPIYISGHKNPDTDSIIGSICYADLKKKKGVSNALACRLGEINAESRFVLDRYKLEEPKLLKSVKMQVSDLNMDEVLSINGATPIKQAMETMHNTGAGAVVVIDDGGKLEGIVTFGDIARSDIQLIHHDNTIATTVENVVSTLSATVICGNGGAVKGRVRILPGKEHLRDAEGIVIVPYEDGIEQAAAASGAQLVVICKGVGARKLNEPISTNTVVTSFGMFEAARLISQSVPVANVMVKEKLVTFNIDDYIDDVREVMTSTRIRSFPVLNESGIVVGIITRNHLIKSNKKQVILIDHNEKAQSIPGIDQAVITEIIDHHRVADLETAQPLTIRSEPVGSSNTIIASMFREANIIPEKTIAGAMLCGILSDTVLFKSPTCTHRDKDMAMYLAEIAGEDIDELGNDLFTAGSTLVKEGAHAMVNKDFKEFTLGGKTVGIGQITIWDTDLVMPVQNEIIDVMNNLIKDKGYDMILFMETSIKKEGTLLVCAGDYEKTVESAFGKKPEGGQIYLDGVMSRKKQIVPPVQGALA